MRCMRFMHFMPCVFFDQHLILISPGMLRPLLKNLAELSFLRDAAPQNHSLLLSSLPLSSLTFPPLLGTQHPAPSLIEEKIRLGGSKGR
jgi:hypothetical protein